MTQAYRIRRHPNARRITLKVHPDQSVEVVAPPRLSQRRIGQMVDARRDWIEAARARILRQQQARPAELDNPFPSRIALPAIGRTLVVEYSTSGSRSRLRWPDRNTLTIAGPSTPERTATALIDALKTIARAELEPRLHALADAQGFKVERVSWRNQKSRWGSCRRVAEGIGRISLNIRLLLLPSKSARYVMVHELAHIEHPDHSPAFWQRVEQMQPEYRDQIRHIKHMARHLPCWIL